MDPAEDDVGDPEEDLQRLTRGGLNLIGESLSEKSGFTYDLWSICVAIVGI